MPKRNFVTHVRNNVTGAVLAKFVHIDTTPVVGMYEYFPENSIMTKQLRECEKESRNTWVWLKESLSGISNETGYTFVVGHHPVRSNFFSDGSAKQVRYVVKSAP